jgi:isopentenyl diphosphate isomerase/L-lactate dehydrogenase-like FMN-dependent dehydrogenase
VVRAIEILREDVDRTMRLLGCRSVKELDPSYVRYPSDWKPSS